MYSQVLTPADHYPPRSRKIDKILALKLDCEDKIRDIHKIEKKNSISISVLGYENDKKLSICISKKCYEDKYFDLLLIGEKDKKHHVLRTERSKY